MWEVDMHVPSLASVSLALIRNVNYLYSIFRTWWGARGCHSKPPVTTSQAHEPGEIAGDHSSVLTEELVAAWNAACFANFLSCAKCSAALHAILLLSVFGLWCGMSSEARVSDAETLMLLLTVMTAIWLPVANGWVTVSRGIVLLCTSASHVLSLCELIQTPAGQMSILPHGQVRTVIGLVLCDFRVNVPTQFVVSLVHVWNSWNKGRQISGGFSNHFWDRLGTCPVESDRSSRPGKGLPRGVEVLVAGCVQIPTPTSFHGHQVIFDLIRDPPGQSRSSGQVKGKAKPRAEQSSPSSTYQEVSSSEGEAPEMAFQASLRSTGASAAAGEAEKEAEAPVLGFGRRRGLNPGRSQREVDMHVPLLASVSLALIGNVNYLYSIFRTWWGEGGCHSKPPVTTSQAHEPGEIAGDHSSVLTEELVAAWNAACFANFLSCAKCSAALHAILLLSVFGLWCGMSSEARVSDAETLMLLLTVMTAIWLPVANGWVTVMRTVIGLVLCDFRVNVPTFSNHFWDRLGTCPVESDRSSRPGKGLPRGVEVLVAGCAG
ncbi:unnamed protein product, partial [Polarella glacialis]